MRLIDADALMPNAEYKGRYDVVTAYDIANAPTIEPEPQWIPCSEGLPEDVEIGEEYPMVIFCTIDETYYGFLEYTEHGRTWWSGDAEYEVDEVIAWMPLPKPYGGEQE